jgi:glutathione S-transferase
MPTTAATALASCTLVLYVKFLVSTMVQGRLAFSAGSRAPEDNALPQAKGQPTQGFGYREPPDSAVRAAAEAEQRWRRIVQNDLESIPLALGVFVVALSVGADDAALSVLVVAYTCLRLAHTVSYATKHPRARMAAWALGALCIVGAAITAVVAVA